MMSTTKKLHYLLLGLISLFVLSVMGYSFYSSHKMINNYSPLVDATMELKLEVTTAHLWFEEKISGDRYESFDEIVAHIDEAHWYANAMLHGGENAEGRFLPLDEPLLRKEIMEVIEHLKDFEKITHMRYKAVETSGIGTEIDQRYDKLFRQLVKQVDDVETLLQKKIKKDYSNYRVIQILLMLIMAGLAGLVIVVQYRHDRTIEENIIELNTAKEKAEQSENWLKTTMNSMGDAVIITDHHGVVSYMNPVASSLTGWLLNDAKNKHINDIFNIINEYTKKPVENPINEVIKKNMVVGLANHTELISKTGEVWPISDSAAPIFDQHQNLRGVVIVFHEITAQKKAEAEKAKLEANLRQAFKMEAIGTLAGGIAHDFNNILGMIIGNAEIANEDIPEDHALKHNIGEILKASARAKDIVRQILSFSRRGEIKKEPHSLPEMVRDSMKSLQTTIPASVEKIIQIDPAKLAGQKEDIVIISDATQIHQLMLNICVNAVQAMEEKGRLTVGVNRVTFSNEQIIGRVKIETGTYAHLYISDTGPGIGWESIDRIFDPFYTTKEVGKGTGMGLSVVHGIVEDHGGKITVESKPDKGATFHVYFPVTDQVPAVEEIHSGSNPRGSEHILLVDDEQMLLDVARNILERSGYQVTAETDSIKALSYVEAEKDRFDIVITDQTMPKLTGEELSRAVKELNPNLPVILCTGYSSKVDKEKAKEIGVNAFAEKPMRSSDILRLIRDVLDP